MSQLITPQKRPSFLRWSEIQKWTSTASLLRFKNIPEGWRLIKISDFATLIDNKVINIGEKKHLWRYQINALKGMGAHVRLVMLPKESHGYSARESVLHVIWEQDQWLEKWVNNKK